MDTDKLMAIVSATTAATTASIAVEVEALQGAPEGASVTVCGKDVPESHALASAL